MVSEWRSVIAVSLDAMVASALSNRQNCTCAHKTLPTQRGRTHGAGCVRQWFRTAEPLGERRYENWNTHTQMTLTDLLLLPILIMTPSLPLAHV